MRAATHAPVAPSTSAPAAAVRGPAPARAAPGAPRPPRASRLAPLQHVSASYGRSGGAAPTPRRAAPTAAAPPNTDTLDLTPENVETVLDEVRPYLMAGEGGERRGGGAVGESRGRRTRAAALGTTPPTAPPPPPPLSLDGGDVELIEIDGPVVYLKLKGACGSCPSSTATMTMGVKRRLQEKIPEIAEVEQVMDDAAGLELTDANVETVLDEIRPYLVGTGGGGLDLVALDGPLVKVRITGPAAGVMTVRVAVTQKLRERFPAIAAVQLVA